MLERELRELGGLVELPPTPDLAAAVRWRLAEAPPARRRLLARRTPALAFAALLVALGAALAVPQSRAAILDFLGLRGVKIERVETLPPAEEKPIGADLGLGRRVTLAEARELAGFPVVVPQALGQPDEVYYSAAPGMVSFLYRTGGKPILFTQFRGTTRPEIVKKSAGPETRIELETVDGEPGYWLAGKPHFFVFVDELGEFREETIRLAGNTLLWERGGLTLRLEANVTKERALEIAASLR